MKPTIVVLAAGMGSRYGGVKQIDAVGMNGETLLDFGIYDAQKSGFGKVVFIIRKDIEKDFRERLFDRIARNMDATYVFQDKHSFLGTSQVEQSVNRQKPWGTVHALLCAQTAVSTPYAVINSDDFYGRKAYQIMADHLKQQSDDSTNHAMVGYILNNTMSREGSVSRGLCEMQDGYLTSMNEHTKIYYENDRIFSDYEGRKIPLTGEEWVSMNFFGFTPRSFDSFNQYWQDFTAKSITEPKKECLLPNAAGSIVKGGEGSIRLYTTDEKWFGMTYHEDREIVKRELKKKIQSGYYPEQLWK